MRTEPRSRLPLQTVSNRSTRSRPSGSGPRQLTAIGTPSQRATFTSGSSATSPNWAASSCPFTGRAVMSRPCGCGQPGIAFEGGVDGVDRGDVVAAGADEVGADAAVSGEGGQRVPVAGDGLVSFGAFEGLLGGVVRPGHGEVSGEGPDLLGFGGKSAGEGVSGMVAVGPVAVLVGGDSPLDRLVDAITQVGE